jgi:hypothetical protein
MLPTRRKICQRAEWKDFELLKMLVIESQGVLFYYRLHYRKNSMKPRSPQTSPPYMNRAFQWRKIMMVLSLGIVIFAIKVTAQPSFWANLFPEDTPQSTEKPASEPTSGDRNVELVRVEMDEFLSTQSSSESEPTENTETDQTKPEVDTAPAQTVDAAILNQVEEVESSLPELPEEPVEENVEISSDHFRTVEDYSVGVRSTESDSFFHVLSHASRVPLSELNAAAEVNVAREALLSAPDYYRGQVIEIEGLIRRLEKVSAELNGYGIEDYYIAWIITPTSDNVPYRVAGLFVDEALPVSDLIEQKIPVKLSGYFYKIQGYASQSDLQLTPLFIANRITAAAPSDMPISLTETSNPARWLFVVFGAVFMMAIWSVYRSTVGSSRMRSHRKDSIETVADLSEMQGESSIDPGEELRKLTENVDH